MANTGDLYSLHVTASFLDDVRSWEVEPAPMTHAVLMDSIDGIVDGNYDAKSFVFVVMRYKEK